MKFANPKNTVQIQSVGLVAGKPAADFKAGEKMLWNFGMTSTVIRTERETAKTIWIEMECEGREIPDLQLSAEFIRVAN